jgi:hypothetical protein
MIDMPEVKQI